MKIKKWILPVSLGVLLFLGAAVWGYNQLLSRRAAETALSNRYNLAYFNLVNNLQVIEMLLSKTLVGDETSQDIQLFSQLWREANSAQANLGQIPVPEAEIAKTIKFLNQIGAYAQTLGIQTAGGSPKTEEQWKTLQVLYKQSKLLNEEIAKIGEELSSGRLLTGEIARVRQWRAGGREPQDVRASFRNTNENMQQFPTLIYDGPFSDHLAKKEPAGLHGAQVSVEQAKEKALAFLGKQAGVNYTVKVIREDKARVPLFRVEAVPNNDQNNLVSMGITQKGGQVLWMIRPRVVDVTKLDITQAGDIAALFLRERGFEEMEKTYYETRNNIAIFNFAATQEGVILYPDQVKVSIALDNGQVLGMDANNYWMSHKTRKLPQPKLTVAQAKEKLSPKLKDVTPGRLALIPVSVDREVLAYEFQGRLDQDVFLLYIDAVTGEEQKILRVIKTNNGVLTM